MSFVELVNPIITAENVLTYFYGLWFFSPSLGQTRNLVDQHNKALYSVKTTVFKQYLSIFEVEFSRSTIWLYIYVGSISLYSTHESLFTITSFRAGLLLFQQCGTYNILFTIKFFFLNQFVHKQKHVWYSVRLLSLTKNSWSILMNKTLNRGPNAFWNIDRPWERIQRSPGYKAKMVSTCMSTRKFKWLGTINVFVSKSCMFPSLSLFASPSQCVFTKNGEQDMRMKINSLSRLRRSEG